MTTGCEDDLPPQEAIHNKAPRRRAPPTLLRELAKLLECSTSASLDPEDGRYLRPRRNVFGEPPQPREKRQRTTSPSPFPPPSSHSSSPSCSKCTSKTASSAPLITGPSSAPPESFTGVHLSHWTRKDADLFLVAKTQDGSIAMTTTPTIPPSESESTFCSPFAERFIIPTPSAVRTPSLSSTADLRWALESILRATAGATPISDVVPSPAHTVVTIETLVETWLMGDSGGIQ